jgi:hypothetical protein
MYKSLSAFVCIAAALILAQSALAASPKKLPTPKASGLPKADVCAGIPKHIEDATAAIKKSRAVVEQDWNLSVKAKKPAPSYPKASLDQIDGALKQIDILNGIIATNEMTYALAGGSVFGYMTEAVVLLQRAQWQTLASAGNNQLQQGLESYKLIVTAITKAEDTATQAGFCYISGYLKL